MSSRKQLEGLTLGNLRNELRRYGITPIPTTKAKCIEELTLYLGEEESLDNPMKDQIHEVDKTPDQPSLANEPTEVGTPLVIQPPTVGRTS